MPDVPRVITCYHLLFGRVWASQVYVSLETSSRPWHCPTPFGLGLLV